MRIHRRIKNLTSPEKEQFEEYFQARIEALLQKYFEGKYDEDSVQVDVNIEKHDKHTAFAIGVKVSIPGAKFIADEVKHTITEPVDLALKKIESQIREHHDRMTSKK